MSEWKTIDSAPKDGSRVLFFTSKPFKNTNIARWVGAPHNVWIADGGSYIRSASHWMSLPDPPVTP